MAINSLNSSSFLNTKSTINNTNNQLDTTFKRLSSGKRINSAKDDAAALEIMNRLTSQVQGLNQGNRNANDGIALAQTAEGAMSEMTNMYSRIRELASQAANGTYSDADRAAMQQEVDSLSSEINRISEQTTFGGTPILNGQAGANSSFNFQVGANANDTISANIGDMSINGIRDQIASANPNYDDSAAFTQNGSFNVSSSQAAQETLNYIDNYLQSVDANRSQLGSVQNRLDSTISNQTNTMINVSDARSRISDTDYAQATSDYAQQNILLKGAISVLLQGKNMNSKFAYSLLN